MAERITIDFICEDSGHESLLEPLIRRLVREQGFSSHVRLLDARGGAPAVHEMVILWAAQVRQKTRALPDILVVGHDANCQGHLAKQKDISEWAAEFRDCVVPACPNPHIERWYMADQSAFLEVVGGKRLSIPKKCGKDIYKNLLRNAVSNADHIAPAGGVEFGPEIAAKIDPNLLEKNDPSFKAFYRALRARLNQIRPLR